MGERMSAVAAIPASGGHRSRAAATALLGIAAIAIWWPVLGPGTLAGLPMVALAVYTVAGGFDRAGGNFGQLVAWAWLPWTPIAVLLAGVPASVLDPTAFRSSLDAFAEAVAYAIQNRGAGAQDPWVLGAWLVASGMAWSLGAAQSTRPRAISAAISFFLLAIPFALELTLRRADDAAWHGAVILAAALLWATRGTLRAAIPAAATVALIGAVASVSFGPKERWEALTPAGSSRFASLDSRQTYGPMVGERNGSTMLEISSPTPSLWRMQVLDLFDGRGWDTDPSGQLDDLPQPAATPLTSTVRVRGLRDPRVASAGRVVATGWSGQTRQAVGAMTLLAPAPVEGETYTVTAAVVDADPDALRAVKLPIRDRYERYTLPMPAVASAGDAALPLGALYPLARSLSQGATSELEVVERVKAHLLSSEFRYSTDDVPQPGAQPLVDFLLTTKVGYCQHFAGAAALLLRLAGVPTRVVAGFATGEETSPGRYRVRDKDAHAWIEVYFPGVGWQPFNPTPAGADAIVAPGIDPPPAEPRGDAARAGGSRAIAGMIIAALAIAGGVFALVRRRRGPQRPPVPMGELLARLVPPPNGPSLTLTELAPGLAAIGPASAALGREVEQQRFATHDAPAPEPHPRRRVWGAVLRDLGPWRGAVLLTFGPRRPPVEGGPVVAAGAPATVVAPAGSSVLPSAAIPRGVAPPRPPVGRSVAPPPGSAPPARAPGSAPPPGSSTPPPGRH